MHLRILEAADAGRYRAMRLDGLEESPHAFSDDVEDERATPLSEWEQRLTPEGSPPDRYVLGAFVPVSEGSADTRLVGIVTFHRDRRKKALHKAMVHAMHVSASARRSGVGAALMAEVVRRARELEGLEQIHLWVLTRPGVPSAATAFYASRGFVGQGPRVVDDLRVDGESIDAEYMVLRLAAREG